MKEKILAQLVTKYPGVSKKVLGLFLPGLEAKVTEESQIEGAISELDNLPIPIPQLATEFQKEGDDRVTVAKRQWLKTPPKPDKPEGKTEKPDEGSETTRTDETPEWAKILMQEVQQLKAEKQTASMQAKVTAHEKMKGIPQAFTKGRVLPEKEEDVETWVTDVANDWTELTKQLPAPGVVGATRPGAGSGTANTGKVDNDVVAFAKKQAEKAQESNTVKP